MATTAINIQVELDGVRYALSETSAAFDLITVFPVNSIAAAKTGQLTTRTDNDTGVLTMDSGHGFITGDKVDVYWTTSSVQYCRRLMSATVSGDAVTVDGGSGTSLPSNLTSIVAMVPYIQTVTLDTADFIAWAARTSTTKAMTISVGTTTGGNYTEGAAVTLNGSDGTYNDCLIWASTYFGTNPIDAASSFNTIRVSHGDTSAATITMTIAST